MADNKELKLFSDFTAPTRQEWLDKIQVDLKGADFQKKMVWRTNEGFSMQPFYLKEDVDKLPTVNALPGEYPYVRGNKKAENNWHVRQDIRCASAKEANEALRLRPIFSTASLIVLISPRLRISLTFIVFLIASGRISSRTK